jgi:DNA-binding CsgD family transcriptional regulator
VQTLRLRPVELPGAEALPPFLEPLARIAAEGGDVVPEIRALVLHFKFSSFTYWAATRSTPLVEGRLYELSTLDPGWAWHYDKKAYVEVDPRVDAALNQSLPLAWDQGTWRDRANVKAFLDDAAAFGVGNGLCIPFHDPSFGFARFDLVATPGEPDSARQAEIQNLFADLSIVARYLHDLFVVAIRSGDLRPRSIGTPLSSRECKCLVLAARGLDYEQIARDLAIDVRFVITHFDSIRAKLGCLNIHEAVAHAIKHGLTAP